MIAITRKKKDEIVRLPADKNDLYWSNIFGSSEPTSILEVQYIDNPPKWVKCVIVGTDGYNRKRGIGMAIRHAHDKFDLKIGREIAFAKAVADLFNFNNHKLFSE